MTLLFDQNLSPRLPHRLRDLFPDSKHVIDVGTERMTDTGIWEFAKSKKFTIVTKDKDFVDKSSRLGQPPKVIKINLGNCPTTMIESIIRTNAIRIAMFEKNKKAMLLLNAEKKKR